MLVTGWGVPPRGIVDIGKAKAKRLTADQRGFTRIGKQFTAKGAKVAKERELPHSRGRLCHTSIEASGERVD